MIFKKKKKQDTGQLFDSSIGIEGVQKEKNKSVLVGKKSGKRDSYSKTETTYLKN